MCRLYDWGWPHYAEIDEIRKKADGTNRSRPFTIDLWCRSSRPVQCRHSCGCNSNHLPYFGIDSCSGAISWIPSIIYGTILWIWWAGIAHLLWRTGDRYPLIFRASVPNLLLQIFLGVFVCALIWASLHLATRIMGRIWAEWHVAGFDTLHFFEIGRYSLDFLVYALVWSACAIIRLHMTAQREAFHSLELRQQLSVAKLHALQMQLQPHFLFNTLNAITTAVRTARPKEADADAQASETPS